MGDAQRRSGAVWPYNCGQTYLPSDRLQDRLQGITPLATETTSIKQGMWGYTAKYIYIYMCIYIYIYIERRMRQYMPAFVPPGSQLNQIKLSLHHKNYMVLAA